MEFLTEVSGPLLLLIAGAIGFGLRKIRDYIAATPTKLDDVIWNKLVNELTAVGTITPDQLSALKNMGTQKGGSS